MTRLLECLRIGPATPVIKGWQAELPPRQPCPENRRRALWSRFPRSQNPRRKCEMSRCSGSSSWEGHWTGTPSTEFAPEASVGGTCEAFRSSEGPSGQAVEDAGSRLAAPRHRQHQLGPSSSNRNCPRPHREFPARWNRRGPGATPFARTATRCGSHDGPGSSPRMAGLRASGVLFKGCDTSRMLVSGSVADLHLQPRAHGAGRSRAHSTVRGSSSSGLMVSLVTRLPHVDRISREAARAGVLCGPGDSAGVTLRVLDREERRQPVRVRRCRDEEGGSPAVTFEGLGTVRPGRGQH